MFNVNVGSETAQRVKRCRVSRPVRPERTNLPLEYSRARRLKRHGGVRKKGKIIKYNKKIGKYRESQ